MRCTQCEVTIKPVVAIDIDGTLGDYHGHFHEFAAAYLGNDTRYYMTRAGVRGYDGTVPHRDWFCEVFGTDPTMFRQIKLAYRQGGMKRSMPAFAGARELCERARAAGAEVWITTTRPWERYDRVDPDTRFWLWRHDVIFDGLIYDDDKMDKLCSYVGPERVVMVLDDLRETLEDVEGLFGREVGILRRTTYNRAVNWPMIVSDLGAAALKAEAAIGLWKENHD